MLQGLKHEFQGLRGGKTDPGVVALGRNVAPSFFSVYPALCTKRSDGFFVRSVAFYQHSKQANSAPERFFALCTFSVYNISRTIFCDDVPYAAHLMKQPKYISACIRHTTPLVQLKIIHISELDVIVLSEHTFQHTHTRSFPDVKVSFPPQFERGS